MRPFPSYQGQRNFQGLYFAASMGRHVGFESWLERDQLMMHDFSPRVRRHSGRHADAFADAAHITAHGLATGSTAIGGSR